MADETAHATPDVAALLGAMTLEVEAGAPRRPRLLEPPGRRAARGPLDRRRRRPVRPAQGEAHRGRDPRRHGAGHLLPDRVGAGGDVGPGPPEEVGTALGEEARAEGVSVLLGPGANIKRTAVCGRNFEYFSEDPFLSSRLAAAWVAGVQSTGVGASLKHFAANNQEHHRYSVDALVDERALREIYLASFEQRGRRRATGDCDGGVQPAQRRLLYDQRGAADRGSCARSGASTGPSSPTGAPPGPGPTIEAGLDLDMPGFDGRGGDDVLRAIHSGTLSRGCAGSGRRQRDPPDRADRGRAAAGADAYDRAVHHALARKAAAAGTVRPAQRTARAAVIAGRFDRVSSVPSPGSRATRERGARASRRTRWRACGPN